MKRFGIIYVLMAVALVAVASSPEPPLPLRVTNVATNATYTSDSILGQGWIESATIWPDTAGGTFTGSVALVLVEINKLAGIGSITTLYSNDTFIAKTTIQPRRNVHTIASGAVTNAGTVVTRYFVDKDSKLVLYARNTVLASNKNVSAFISLEK